MPDMKDLLGALSGGKEEIPTIDPNTGAAGVQSQPQSTGGMFKSMFQGMLTGLAGGVQANANGAHGALGAFTGGYDAQQKAQQAQMVQKKQAAQQQFENQQKSVKQQSELAFQRQQQATSIAEQHHLEALTSNLESADKDQDLTRARQHVLDVQAADDRATVLAKYPSVPGSPVGTRSQVEDWVNKNLGVVKDPNIQVITDPDTNLTRLVKIPNGGPKSRDLELPDGTKTTQVMDDKEYANFQISVAKEKRAIVNENREGRLTDANIARSQAETRESEEKINDARQQRKELGDFKKGERAALVIKNSDNLLKINSALTKMKQMGTDKDEKGNPTDEYQDLQKQYQDARDNAAYLRQQPGAPQPQGTGTVLPAPSAKLQIGLSHMAQLKAAGVSAEQRIQIIDSSSNFTAEEKARLKNAVNPYENPLQLPKFVGK